MTRAGFLRVDFEGDGERVGEIEVAVISPRENLLGTLFCFVFYSEAKHK